MGSRVVLGTRVARQIRVPRTRLHKGFVVETKVAAENRKIQREISEVSVETF